MKKQLRKLVIDRKRWLRGSAKVMGKTCTSELRNEAGQMCCLGFLARDIGATVEQITGEMSPEDVPELPWPKGLLKEFSLEDEWNALVPEVTGKLLIDTDLTVKIIVVNDQEPDVKRREAKLRLFRRLGYELEFKN